MNLVRKLKISKISNTSINLSSEEMEIVHFMDDAFSNLEEFHLNEYAQSIFFLNKKGDWIVDYDKKHNRIYCSYDGFLNILENKYFLKIQDINYLFSHYFKKYIDMDVYKIEYIQRFHYHNLEREYRNRKIIYHNDIVDTYHINNPNARMINHLNFRYVDDTFFSGIENIKNLLKSINNIPFIL